MSSAACATRALLQLSARRDLDARGRFAPGFVKAHSRRVTASMLSSTILPARWHGLARAFSLVLALVATTCVMGPPARAQTHAGRPLTATTSAAPPEGSFVSTPDGRVYRIAGGAPCTSARGPPSGVRSP